MKDQLHGIRVYSELTFEESFSCIFPYFENLYFCEAVGDSCFRFPFDDDSVFERHQEVALDKDLDQNLMFHSRELIRLAGIVSEDWNAISLLESTDFFEHSEFDHRISELIETSSVMFPNVNALRFHNYDGCFWQFFTNIQGISESMISAHFANDSVDLRIVEIAANYWSVGEYREDYPIRVR